METVQNDPLFRRDSATSPKKESRNFYGVKERDAHKRNVLPERLEKHLDANGEILSDRLIRNRGTKMYLEAVETETKYRMNLERNETGGSA